MHPYVLVAMVMAMNCENIVKTFKHPFIQWFYSFIYLFKLVWAFNILQEIYFKRDNLSQIPCFLNFFV
jgi:hypothetical protein